MLLKVNKTQEIKNSVDFIKFFIKHLILFLRMYVSMQMSTIYITLNDWCKKPKGKHFEPLEKMYTKKL